MNKNKLIRYTIFSGILLFTQYQASAQLWKKLPGFSDKPNADSLEEIKQLKLDLANFAPEKTGLRKLNTLGEANAVEYIGKTLSQLGYRPLGGNNYKQVFKLKTSTKISYDSKFKIGNQSVSIPTDAAPFPFSSVGTYDYATMPGSYEPENVWIKSLYDNSTEAYNAGFNAMEAAYTKALYAKSRGAAGIIFYDEFGTGFNPNTNNPKTQFANVGIPVWFVNKHVYDTHIRFWNFIQPLSITEKFEEVFGTGVNIIAYQNNNANASIIICAHFDNGGNGTNDNGETTVENRGSGVAVMLDVARKLKDSKLKNYNYIFVGFTGDGNGTEGVNAFLNGDQLKNTNINCVINLDQLGNWTPRLKTFNVAGNESANNWHDYINEAHLTAKINYEKPDVNDALLNAFFEKKIPSITLSTLGEGEDTHDKQGVVGNIKGLREGAIQVMLLLNVINQKGRLIFNQNKS